MWVLLTLSVIAILVMLPMVLLGAWMMDRRRRRPDGLQGPEPDWARIIEGPKGELPNWTPMRDRSFDPPR